MADPADKPSVLIIGGLGYTGRFLAKHLHDAQLASDVRIVDKHLPELAWLAPEFADACSREKFMQADASREQSLTRIFDRADGKQFDYVFNCGGETRYSQEDEVYKMRSYALSMAVGGEAARRKVKAFVELSTGMVYKPEAPPRKETDKLKPWLKMAKWKLQAEEDLAKIEGLNLIIMRLPHVYGPYTSKFLATALCMARVYQSLGKEMKWLWKDELRSNTVHVEDVARALWTAADWYHKKAEPKPKPAIFNVVDHTNTSQGILANLIHETFNIPTGFHGTLISAFARLNLEHVVDDVNDETLDPWAELQEKAGISKANPNPLSPFMEKEILKDTDLSMDGSLFEQETGFEYKHPILTKDKLEDVVESYKRMGWWP
ncbi:nad dependent epimerase dehydratase family protein [Diplodia corticola]|uniref:Nad dependent epimerase dehydratase family protein n=1 Tax=Diplodia corticola TaxID=236234 RepID=A0A1J9QLZ1_9PEZI|nr:nad dependent epimerase dehydratase family protein [Diplodia corticola]OJD29480.1 nad dependent epimerase dehydratase family protein [Diplodia corticola]